MRTIERLVAYCVGRAYVVIAAALIAAGIAYAYTASHFRIDTNSETLVSSKIDWRQRDIRFDKLFPQRDRLILVVVDGETPELAESAAKRLTASLTARKDMFLNVRRPDGGPFFDQNGILFRSKAEVQDSMQQLIEAQPFLGAVAADPSLRGIMDSLSLMLEGVKRGQTKIGTVLRPIERISNTLDDVLSGKHTFLAWRSLVTGKPAERVEKRRLIMAQTRLDYNALEPGEAATTEIRREAAMLHLTADEGVRVRLTGPVPLSDEEFATLADRAGLMGALMFGAIILTLWLALRSFRLIVAILITVVAGLLLTMGLGLAIVGVFNIISIAFIALFVGLGVDFGIQYCVRYRAERFLHHNLLEALRQSGRNVGFPLALAAAATAVGFFSFLPTSYVGVAELGLIAGIGMIIAFLLSVTFLPALLVLFKPGDEAEEVGFSGLAPADRFLARHRVGVLRAAFVVAIVALAILPGLTFDFNPLDLRSPKVESMSTLFDLMNDARTSPNTIDVLEPSLDQADRVAARLSNIPEVGQTVTLKSFVPDDQQSKLVSIQDAQSLLDPTLNPFGVKPPPSDADIVASLKSTAQHLREVAASDQQNAPAVLKFAQVLDRLSSASPALRARATDALVPGLATMLDQVRSALTAQTVTLKTLPPDLVHDWVALDGEARVQLSPKDGARSNEALKRFSDAVLAVAPNATGTPISIQDYGRTILRAFIQAGVLSTIAIIVLLFVALRRARDVLLTMIPLLLTGILTLATCVIIGLNLNFANVIALPLLLGIGVAFDIYFIIAWRNGAQDFLQTSLARAVIFSALTTASGFGTLWLSRHPGTASMGELLMISLGWTLATTLFFLPALLKSSKSA
jgi:hopanoid biosynthesis associated RND transporter like protein HpnN